MLIKAHAMVPVHWLWGIHVGLLKGIPYLLGQL